MNVMSQWLPAGFCEQSKVLESQAALNVNRRGNKDNISAVRQRTDHYRRYVACNVLTMAPLWLSFRPCRFGKSTKNEGWLKSKYIESKTCKLSFANRFILYRIYSVLQ